MTLAAKLETIVREMRSCFFVSRIGDVGSPERDCSDKLLKYIIEPALQRCGYDRPRRADQITKPGIIVSQVFKELWEADLVIADLTGHNPNVFYELAVRHVVRKPFVQMIRKSERLPFDIAANRTIHFDFDVAEANKASDDLESMINAAESDPSCSETPLSFAIDTLSLGKSGKSPETGIADALFMLQGLQGMVSETLEVTRSEAEKRRKIDPLDAFLPLFEDLLPLLPFFKEAIRNAKMSMESASAVLPTNEPAKALPDTDSESAKS
jgi:hypothetical protein